MSRYNANGTMRLIAKQDVAEVYEVAPNTGDVIRDIVTAIGIPNIYSENGMMEVGLDIILYGVILGKRIERQRNKSKYGLTAPQRRYIKVILEDVQKDNQKGGGFCGY